MSLYDAHENANTAVKLAWQKYETALANNAPEEQLHILMRKWRTGRCQPKMDSVLISY